MVKKKYPDVQLTLTWKQALILENCLDLMIRLGLGQVREVADYLPKHKGSGDRSEWDRDEVLYHLDAIIRGLGFHGWGHSYGVGNSNVPDRAHIAYDIGAVLRVTMSDAMEHPGVWQRNPLHCGSLPLCKAELIEDEE